MPPSLTGNGDFGERSAARSWSVTDWARTSLGLASLDGSCSRQAASATPDAASTTQRIPPGHTLRSTPPTLTNPQHLRRLVRTTRTRMPRKLFLSSTAFLTVLQPFVIYGRKSSYIGCRSPIYRPVQCCVNTHARRIIGEIWRLPLGEIFSACWPCDQRRPVWCACRQGFAGIVGIHRPAGRRIRR